jgi:glycosyltransferase involved in cell wall biosynthesis
VKLYGVCPVKFNASNWYRTMMPWRTAQRMKIADPIIDQMDIKIENELERRTAATMYADIIQHYQSYSEGFRHSSQMARTFPSYWETEDKWNVGPSFIFDTDDDLFRVEALNPAFKYLGQMVNGRQLRPGENVQIMGEDGKMKMLFEDGKDGFDIVANTKRLDGIRMNLNAADLVTCTTPGSRDYVLREAPDANVHIFPNCIDFADWPKVRLAEDDKVRILWQSSSCHFEDIWPLRKTLGKIHRKYPHVEFILFGSPYEWLVKELVPERTTVLGWVNYDQYILHMSMFGHDINIAPLHASTFNQSRSGIRMYESAATWKPAATLAERTGPYKAEIIEGETGMLFDTVEEFETKLCALIEDATLRKTIASNAKDWVRTHRSPYVHVPALIEAYQRVRDGHKAKAEPPAPLETPIVTTEASD